MRIPTTLLLAAASTATVADTGITLTTDTGDAQYEIEHWETGATYRYTATQDRTVSVPHSSGTLIVRRDGYAVEHVDAAATPGAEQTEWADADDVGALEGDTADAQSTATDAQDAAGDARDSADEAQSTADAAQDSADDARAAATTAELDALDAQDAAASNTARLDDVETRLDGVDTRLDRHAAGLASVAALASHTTGGGLRLSVAGGRYGAHQATSVALSYGGERVSGRVAVAGDVVAGSVGVRLW